MSRPRRIVVAPCELFRTRRGNARRALPRPPGSLRRWRAALPRVAAAVSSVPLRAARAARSD